MSLPAHTESMSKNASYRLTTLSDLEYLSTRLREEDIQEIIAASGTDDIFKILKASYKTSDECYTIINPQGSIGGIFGIGSQYNIGAPWMLATEGIEKYSKSLIKNNRECINRWLDRYLFLMNYVDVRNKTAIKWLRFLGFKMMRTVTLHDPDVPFYEFVQARIQ